jgi:hypothetical protein
MPSTDNPNPGAVRGRRARALKIVTNMSGVMVLVLSGYLWLVAKEPAVLICFLLSAIGLAGTVWFEVLTRRKRVR